MQISKKIYISKKNVEIKTYQQLKKEMNLFCDIHTFVTNKRKKRKIFLEKLPNIILERKSSRKKRLMCFIVAMDILKNSKNIIQNIENKNEYAFCGISKNGYFVEVHVREEFENKDRKYQFISCFWKEKKTSTH